MYPGSGMCVETFTFFRQLCGFGIPVWYVNLLGDFYRRG